MPNDRRVYLPSGIYFFTLVTYCRRPLFKDPANVQLLRLPLLKLKPKNQESDVWQRRFWEHTIKFCLLNFCPPYERAIA